MIRFINLQHCRALEATGATQSSRVLSHTMKPKPRELSELLSHTHVTPGRAQTS